MKTFSKHPNSFSHFHFPDFFQLLHCFCFYSLLCFLSMFLFFFSLFEDIKDKVLQLLSRVVSSEKWGQCLYSYYLLITKRPKVVICLLDRKVNKKHSTNLHHSHKHTSTWDHAVAPVTSVPLERSFSGSFPIQQVTQTHISQEKTIHFTLSGRALITSSYIKLLWCHNNLPFTHTDHKSLVL